MYWVRWSVFLKEPDPNSRYSGVLPASFWCINSTDESKRYAREAIELALQSLEKAVYDPDERSREDMAKASNLAGRAINISKTTASHSISYPITSYFGVAHGQAVGVTIPSMIVFNSGVSDDDSLDSRGTDYVKGMMKEIVSLLGCESPEEAKSKVIKLMKSIGLDTRLDGIGIKTHEDIETVIKNGFNPERVKNNPRKVTEEALRDMLNEIR